jgi:hypothetical protein
MEKFKIEVIAGMIISCAGYILVREVIEIHRIRKNGRDLARRANKCMEELLRLAYNDK